jgi:hypothetical protein
VLSIRFGDTAPQFRDALKAAGLTREHEIFSRTMALFGTIACGFKVIVGAMDVATHFATQQHFSIYRAAGRSY